MNPLSSRRVLVNVLMFQAGWFACVLSAAHGFQSAGVALAAAIVAWHLRTAAQPRQELLLVAAAVALGMLWDSTMVLFRWISFEGASMLPGSAPAWILALWALFATSLNVSLRWLRSHMGLAAALGAVAGPLSYLAGERLGALELLQSERALAALAAGWTLFVPMLLMLSQRYDGFSPRAERPA